MTTEDGGIPAATAEADEALRALWGAAKILFDEGARLDRLSGKVGDRAEYRRLGDESSKTMDGATDLQNLVVDIEAKTPRGMAIQRAILTQREESGPRADGRDKALAARLGAGPDKRLLSLEAERTVAYLNPSDDDKAGDATEAMVETPAETVAGVAAKLRISAEYLPKDEGTHDFGHLLLLSALSDAERIGGAA